MSKSTHATRRPSLRTPAPWIFLFGVLVGFAALATPCGADDEPLIFEDGSYVERLYAANVWREAGAALWMEVHAVPCAYVYEMSKEIEKLQSLGLAGPALIAQSEAAHKRLKPLLGRPLVVVWVAATGGTTHSWWRNDPKKHLKAKVGVSSGVKFLQAPKPRFEMWRVFEMPGSHSGIRRSLKASLALVEREAFVAVLARPKSLDASAQVTLSGLIAQTESEHSTHSVNVAERQISCRGLDSIVVSPLSVTFLPGALRVPAPPPEIAAVLAAHSGEAEPDESVEPDEPDE